VIGHLGVLFQSENSMPPDTAFNEHLSNRLSGINQSIRSIIESPSGSSFTERMPAKHRDRRRGFAADHIGEALGFGGPDPALAFGGRRALLFG
jgi:hypothetical protein